MTSDEQEALSRAHDSSAIVILIRLSSGRFAVFNNARELCGTLTRDELAYAVTWWKQWPPLCWRAPAKAPEHPKVNLEELGL